MYDKERAEMAAGFARAFVRADPWTGLTDDQAAMSADMCADLALRMADRIISACTTAGAVVGDELPEVNPDKPWPRA